MRVKPQRLWPVLGTPAARFLLLLPARLLPPLSLSLSFFYYYPPPLPSSWLYFIENDHYDDGIFLEKEESSTTVFCFISSRARWVWAFSSRKRIKHRYDYLCEKFFFLELGLFRPWQWRQIFSDCCLRLDTRVVVIKFTTGNCPDLLFFRWYKFVNFWLFKN